MPDTRYPTFFESWDAWELAANASTAERGVLKQTADEEAIMDSACSGKTEKTPMCLSLIRNLFFIMLLPNQAVDL
jgi:hypothetical protein